MIRFLLISLVTLFFSGNLYSQDHTAKSLVKWYTLDEAVKLQEKQAKTILIDMHTSWCGWCKVMDTTTFVNPQIASYINTYFYPVKFDAETKDTIVYRGKTYYNTGQGRRPPHQLAVEMLKGRMSYPTLVYIDDQFNANPVPGYMDPLKIEPVLVYFAERVNKSAPFDDFKEKYIQVIREHKRPEAKIKWMSFPEAIEKNKSNPKKILVDIYSGLSKSSDIFNSITLSNPEISAYINKHFYPVQIWAENTDTIRVGDQVFVNEQMVPNYPHQLPIALLNGQMQYPSVVFMDENSKMLNKTSGYMTAKSFEPVLHFLAEDFYKTQEWNTFQAAFKGKVTE